MVLYVDIRTGALYASCDECEWTWLEGASPPSGTFIEVDDDLAKNLRVATKEQLERSLWVGKYKELHPNYWGNVPTYDNPKKD